MLFGKMGPTQLSRHLHSHSASLKLAYIVTYFIDLHISAHAFLLFILVVADNARLIEDVGYKENIIMLSTYRCMVGSRSGLIFSGSKFVWPEW